MKSCLFFPMFCCNHTHPCPKRGAWNYIPNSKAALENKGTDKGVFFPRLTSVQRNAIANPPNGLHIFNTDERCLNFYDSLFQVWNCYCGADTCKTVTIPITPGCNVDFYATYAGKHTAAIKYVVLLNANDTVYNCFGTAFNLTTIFRGDKNLGWLINNFPTKKHWLFYLSVF